MSEPQRNEAHKGICSPAPVEKLDGPRVLVVAAGFAVLHVGAYLLSGFHDAYAIVAMLAPLLAGVCAALGASVRRAAAQGALAVSGGFLLAFLIGRAIGAPALEGPERFVFPIVVIGEGIVGAGVAAYVAWRQKGRAAKATTRTGRDRTADTNAHQNETGRPSDSEKSTTAHVGLKCRTCDYDLRGLPLAGRCPECGSRVAASLIQQPSGWAKRLSPISAALAISGWVVFAAASPLAGPPTLLFLGLAAAMELMALAAGLVALLQGAYGDLRQAILAVIGIVLSLPFVSWFLS